VRFTQNDNGEESKAPNLLYPWRQIAGWGIQAGCAV